MVAWDCPCSEGLWAGQEAMGVGAAVTGASDTHMLGLPESLEAFRDEEGLERPGRVDRIPVGREGQDSQGGVTEIRQVFQAL